VRRSILLLCALTLLLSVAAEPSRASEPVLLAPGPGGNPAGINREVLWLDNPDFAENIGTSEVIGAFDLWTEIAVDFVLETNATIRKVTWWGGYWGDFEEPTGAGFNLRFYMDLGCMPEAGPFIEYLLPGDDCCETYVQHGGGTKVIYVYECCFNLPLAPGLYWFSAQMADHEYPPQWGRLGADRTQVCDSMFRGPYFSCPEWVPANDVFEPWDASQMIEDACVPTVIENASWGAVKGLYR